LKEFDVMAHLLGVNIQHVHKKRPPKYNGVVFEILGKHH